MNENPQHTPSDTRIFLDLLEPRGRFTFQTFKDRPSCNTPPIILHGTFEQHLPQLRRLNATGAGCFVTINETDGRGRKVANITRIRAFFVDLDGAPLPESWPLPPHIITETSPGKWHCYWLIYHCDLEHFKPIQQALAKRFGGDPAVCDLPRVMRLPGFFHLKNEPFLSRIIKADPGRYELAIFLKAFKITLPERKQSPEPTRRASHAECTGRMADHLGAIRTAKVGERNDTLNAHAFKIGRLVAAGAAMDGEALAAILEAAAEAGIEGADYTARRSLKEGIQSGPYRHPAPPPHFPITEEPLPPLEARAELASTILNIVNQSENWKFLKPEIQAAIGGEKPRVILEKYGFQDRKHAPRDLIRATPGLGKSRQTITTILNSDLEIAFFYVPTSKLAEELAAAYPGQVKAIKGRCEANCSQASICNIAGGMGIPVYGTFCSLEMEGMGPIRCADFNGCKYLEQFQKTGEKIISLSHEYLKLDFPLLRKLGTPDLHVIDESIIGIVAGTINFHPGMLPVDFRDLQPGDDALARAILRGWTLEDVRDFRDECFNLMQRETLAASNGLHPGLNAEIALARMKAVTKTGAAQRWRFFSVLASQWELGKGAEAIRIGTKPVNVDGKFEQQARVFVSFKRELAGLREGEPILMLDADGSLAVNRALVSERMQEHRIDASRNVLVVQVATGCSKTALGLPEAAASEKLERMAKIIRSIPGQRLLVTYKDAKPLADFGLDDADVTNFGGFLGKNDWQNHDIAIILGRNLPPCEAMEDLARGIFSDSPEPLLLPGRYEQTLQGFTMRDESQRGARVQAHPDGRVNGLLDIHRGRLSGQGADRLRLVNDDAKPKLVIILDLTPTPLGVDYLVTETGLMNMLAVGKMVSNGEGFAVITRPKLEGLGFSVKEAENAIKSMTSKRSLLPPSILSTIYGGAKVIFLNLDIHEIGTVGKSILVATTLDSASTAEKIKRLNPVYGALARSSAGVVPLSKSWLNKNFPEIFASEAMAQRAISTITQTGHCRFHGSKRKTAFLAADDCTDPRAVLEELAGRPLVEYEGPTIQPTAPTMPIIQPAQVTAPTMPAIQPAIGSTYRVLAFDDFIVEPPTPWLVKKAIPSKGVGILTGETSTGKSFVALDLGAAVATGRDFFGHPTQKGRVVFINNDRMLPIRVRAYTEHNGIKKGGMDLLFSNAEMDLLKRGDLAEFTRDLDSITPFELIVIDGLLNYFPWDPLTDTEAASIFKSLSERFQCAVLITMPSDAETPGPVFSAMADFRLETIGTGGHRTLKIGRERYGFNLKKVADSCVIEPHRPMGMVA